MRITFQLEGGLASFPGLSRPVTIEVDALPTAVAAHLRALAGSAAHGTATAASALPDARTYTIRVESESGVVTLRYADPVQDDAARALIDACLEHARAQRGRTGERR